MEKKTVFVAGTGKDLHVFDSKETYELYCEQFNRTFKAKEVEIIEQFEIVSITHTSAPLTPEEEQVVCTVSGTLTDVIRSSEWDIEFKVKGNTWRYRGLDELLGDGDWKWAIRRPGGFFNLWESMWITKKENNITE